MVVVMVVWWCVLLWAVGVVGQCQVNYNDIGAPCQPGQRYNTTGLPDTTATNDVSSV